MGRIEVLSTIASILTAIIAALALHTWKNQTRAQKQIEFIDELTETVHDYIQAMATPLQVWEFTKMSINAYEETEALHVDVLIHQGLKKYINENGKEDQTQLNLYLDKVRPIRSRLDALAIKGQIFGFNNYIQCISACAMLSQSCVQLEACVWLLGSINLNFQNQHVQQTIADVISIDPDIIRDNLQNQNRIVLEFVTQTYSSILGRKYECLTLARDCMLRSMVWIDKKCVAWIDKRKHGTKN